MTASRPGAERPADGDELAQVVSVVVGHQKNGAQVRLRSLAGWDQPIQIDLPIGRELFQGLAIGFEGRDAPVPCLCGRRGGLTGPVVVRPLQLVHVSLVDAEVEDVLLRNAHVLEQLPRGMLEALGLGAALVIRNTPDRRVEADVGFLPIEDASQIRAERIR